MMSRFLHVCLCLMFALSIQAVPAYKGKVTITQPDGTVVTVQLHGDEYLSFTTTADGYSVVKSADGYFRYARKEKGSLVATDVIAHDSDGRTADERHFLSSTKKFLAPEISPEMQEMRRNNIARQREALAKRRAGRFDYDLFRGLLILVEFSDKKFSRNDYSEIINDMVNKENYTGFTDVNGNFQAYTGSVRDYFHDNSSGKFTPQFDVVGPVSVPYKQNDCGSNSDRVFTAAVAAANSLVDYSKYDADADGTVDAIYFIVAGSASSSDPNNPQHLWPYQSTFLYLYNKNFDGKNLGLYACSTELWESEESNVLDGIGTFCHEFSHVLGLPDFYDTDYEQGGGMSIVPGSWSVMADGCYNNKSRTPAGYSLFERYALGFAEPTTINSEGSYTLKSIDEANTGFRINTTVDKEFFFLENRQKTKWDSYLPGTGMLVFRVDSTDARVWTINRVNANPEHNYYELLRAGGYKNGGYASDPFPGKNHITELNYITSPANLMPWADGLTRWGLKNIREQEGVIYFDIEDASDLWRMTLPEEISLDGGETKRLTITFTPTSKAEEVTWTSSDSSIATVDAEGNVTGLKVGICTITATSVSGKTASCKVTVGNGIVQIGPLKFSYSLGNSVATIIQDKSYRDLTEVELPATVTIDDRTYRVAVGSYAFNGCSNITSLKLPEGLESIGDYAFAKMSRLTELELPNSLKKIGVGAFVNNTKLVTVLSHLSDPPVIGDNTFSISRWNEETHLYDSIPSSATLFVPEGTKAKYEAIKGWTMFANIEEGEPMETMVGQLKYYCTTGGTTATVIKDDSYKELTEVSIPAMVIINRKIYRVTAVGENAFYQCNRIKSLSLPEGLESIGKAAFFQVVLSEVNFPSSLKAIGDYAFYNCYFLKSVTFPEGLESIGREAFRSCQHLTRVELPSTLSSIGEEAFSGNNLSVVISHIIDPPVINDNVFANAYWDQENQNTYWKPSPATLLVPEGTKAKYEAIKGWTMFARIEEFEEGTGIRLPQSTAATDGVWYNLQGMKVAEPQKGIFIKSGRKVVIK